MQEQIEKLKNEREKITDTFNKTKNTYKSEIKRIDRAIKSFERGINQLGGLADKPKRHKSSSVIEEILLEFGPLHLKELLEKLHDRGIPMKYQSLSGLIQNYAKTGKRFIKTAPATFGLIYDDDTKSLKSETEKVNVVIKDETLIIYDADTNDELAATEN